MVHFRTYAFKEAHTAYSVQRSLIAVKPQTNPLTKCASTHTQNTNVSTSKKYRRGARPRLAIGWIDLDLENRVVAWSLAIRAVGDKLATCVPCCLIPHFQLIFLFFSMRGNCPPHMLLVIFFALMKVLCTCTSLSPST